MVRISRNKFILPFDVDIIYVGQIFWMFYVDQAYACVWVCNTKFLMDRISFFLLSLDHSQSL